MSYLMIENVGEVDVNSLMIDGCTSKSGDTSKIGKFGSGTKYAAVYAMKQGIDIQIFSGTKHIKYITKQVEIRNQLHDILFLQEGNIEHDMKIDLHKGNFDWNDEWFIIREFMSNAIDEVEYNYSIVEKVDMVGKEGYTRVYIWLSQRLSEVVKDIKDYFLKLGNNTEFFSTSYASAYINNNTETSRIFNKGVYVEDYNNPSIFCYDFNDLELTEARTVKYDSLKTNVAKTLDNAPVDAKVHLLKSIIGHDSGLLEINIYRWYFNDSNKSSWEDAFNQAFPNMFLCINNAVIIKNMEERGHKVVILPYIYYEFLSKCENIKKESDILGNMSKTGHIEITKTVEHTKYLKLAKKLFKNEFSRSSLDKQIKVFESHGHDRSVLGAYENDEIWLNSALFNNDTFNQFLEVYYEELAHCESGYCDETRDFQNFLINKIVGKIKKNKVFIL